MSKKVDTTISLLTNFGISVNEAKVYLEIVQGKGKTALIISRNLKLARTKVYRILDNLIAHGLVVTRLGDRGSLFETLPPEQLQVLLSDREHELAKLRETLPSLQSQLLALENSEPTNSKVLYLHGIEGLKQVTYNSLKAKGELLTYEMDTMNAFVSKEEAEKLRERFVENQIHIRTLTNATHIAPYTDVVELVEEFWEIRHLAPKGNPFKFEILNYNDIYCMYRYVGEEIFCVEIHNQELADMQRQLFEYLWSGAKKFKVINSHGEAKLI